MAVQGSGPKKYVSILQKSKVLATAEIGAGKSKKDSEAAKQWSQKEESRMPFYGVWDSSSVNSEKNGKVLN